MVLTDTGQATARSVRGMSLESRRCEAHDDLASDPGRELDPSTSQSLLQAEAQDEPPGPSKPLQSSPPPDPTSFVTWGICWRHPVLLLCLFAGSLLVAMGHHMFYQSLHQKPVDSTIQQVWAIRIGTGLAFVYKSGLVAILSMVNTQQIWVTLRRKFITLQGIDNMFMLMNDPTALFNRHLWARAKTLILLACVAWLVPLIAIITPATLSVKASVKPQVMPSSVATVDLANATSWGTFAGAGRVERAGSEISRLFHTVASSGSYLPSSAPFPNASYDLSFWAPSYKCVNLSEAVAQSNSLTPSASYNYSTLQSGWDAEMKPVNGQSYAAVAPGFKSNALFIWSGPAAYVNSMNDRPVYANAELVCQLYNTSYEVNMRFDNGIQSITPRSIRYLHLQDWDEGTGSNSALDKKPAIAASYITYLLFQDFLVGKLTIGVSGGLSVTGTSLMKTGLAGCAEIKDTVTTSQGILGFNPGICRNKTLGRAIEDLSSNFTYSLMAAAYNLGRSNTTVPVTISAPRNFYSYDKSTLLTAYLASLSVVLLWMGIGAFALWSNGITSNTSFSAILLTTRNADLDALAQGHCLGADPLPDEIAGVKLRFGRLTRGEPASHAGFGVRGTVTAVEKGDKLL